MILQDYVTKVLRRYGWGTGKETQHGARLCSHKHCGTGDMLKEFVSLTMVAMKMGKKETISVLVATVAKRKKYFIKNMNLLHSKYH